MQSQPTGIFTSQCHHFEDFIKSNYLLKDLKEKETEEHIYRNAFRYIIHPARRAEFPEIENLYVLLWSAFFRAAVSLKKLELARMIRLRERSVNVNMKNDRNLTALMVAAGKDCHYEVVEFLLTIPESDINILNPAGDILLVQTFKARKFKVAKLILSKRCVRLSQKNGDGESVWHCGIEFLDLEMLQLMLQRSLYQRMNNSRLSKRAREKHENYNEAINAIEWNIDVKNSEGRTALHLASIRGHMPITKGLLLAGADPEVRDNFGRTALLVAAHLRRWGLLYVFKQFGKVNYNAIDNNGLNVFHYSIIGSAYATTTELLKPEYGIYVNLPNAEGYSALNMAINSGQIEMVKLLLQHNCRLDEITKNLTYCGNSWIPCFEYAISLDFDRIARMLYETGAVLGVRHHPEEGKYYSFTVDRVMEQRTLSRIDRSKTSRWMEPATLIPRSLKIWSRKVIRRCLPSPIYDFKTLAEDLELPTQLLEYIAMRDL